MWSVLCAGVCGAACPVGGEAVVVTVNGGERNVNLFVASECHGLAMGTVDFAM